MNKIRISFLATALIGAVLAIASSAFAADLPVKAPPVVTPPPPVFNWMGFYVGGQVGYGWGKGTSDSFNANTGAFVASSENDRRGWFGGGQVGYNYVFPSSWLLGIEGDIAGGDISGSAVNCSSATACAQADGKTSWFGTIRGRVGYTWNNWMLFGTGGGAWVHHSTDRTIVVSAALPAAVGAVASSSGTDFGWTAGAGVEWGFLPHWSAKLEYLYIHYDASADFTYPAFPAANRHNESTNHLNIVRLGVNYLFN
jgi:opacity protein-like surface antigen